MAYSIAIDGPAGAGKSSAARELARRLHFDYLDTGAMYRALTYFALRRGICPDDAKGLCDALSDFRLDIKQNRVFVNGSDVSTEIRTPEVTAHVSAVSAHAFVREYMVAMQRDLSAKGNTVLDGRDIGTVVLPHADRKFFLTANPEVRAKRRFLDEKNDGTMTLEEILNDQKRRDAYDASREISPLRCAEDAICIDSSDMTLEEVVEEMRSYCDV